jgi:internalin A
LTSLQLLYLGVNDISDVEPLRNLGNLRYLSLNNNQITDITMLSNLHGIVMMDLSGNEIVSVEPLRAYPVLFDLNLSANQISNIRALDENDGLSSGDNVYLYTNPLSDSTRFYWIPRMEARGVHVHYQ